MATYEDILSDRSWLGLLAFPAPVIVTYSFDVAPPSYVNAANGYTKKAAGSYKAFTATEQAAAEAALHQWELASGVLFVKVAPGQGEITFNKINLDYSPNPESGGYTSIPNRMFELSAYGVDPGIAADGDIYIDTIQTPTGDNLTSTLLHEIGHALGLKHPFDTDGSNHPGTDQTVMDYGAIATHLGPLDLQAIASIYGANSEPANGRLLNWDWHSATKGLVITQNWGDADSNIMGTGQQDVIDAGAGADWVAGFQSNDVLKGGAGNDRLYGGAGDDVLIGGAGDDILFGGDRPAFRMNYGDKPEPGSDTADYSSALQSITVQLRLVFGDPEAKAFGADIGNDTLYDIDNVIGGAGDDSITGDQFANKLSGGAGGDTLNGGRGKDTLTGDASVLDAGHDVFLYLERDAAGKGKKRDVITDFHRGEDKIDLDAIDAKSKSYFSNEDFKWIGKAKFHHKQGELHYVKHGKAVWVEGDVNGDGKADFQIQVNHIAKLGAGDFDL